MQPKLHDLYDLLPKSKDGTLLALDLETFGTDASDPETSIIGIGGADEDGSWYLDVRKLRTRLPGGFLYLCERLRARPLTAFNVVFDWGFLWSKFGLSDLHWECCTYGLFRQLTTEGFKGQTWGLGTLEKEGLGWKYSNKKDLYDMLAKHSLKKDEMGQLADLEPKAFGKYCAEDADAHWQAYEHLLEIVDGLGDVGANLTEFHKGPWMCSAVKQNIEQQLRGIKIDVPKLTAFRERLSVEIETLGKSFFSIPEVVEPMAEWNAKFIKAHLDKEPPTLTAAGKASKRWQTWEEKLQRVAKEQHFNPNSPQQLAWLLFEKLGYPIKEYTETGQPSVGKDFLPFWGAPGKTLLKWKKKIKLRGSFVDTCLELQRDSVLHPQTKSAGTITLRCSGGELEDG